MCVCVFVCVFVCVCVCVCVSVCVCVVCVFVHVSVREHVSVCVSECVSSIFNIQMLLEQQSFHDFQSRLHIAHCNHSCDKRIVTVASNMLSAIEIHVRLHHFNT